MGGRKKEKEDSGGWVEGGELRVYMNGVGYAKVGWAWYSMAWYIGIGYKHKG